MKNKVTGVEQQQEPTFTKDQIRGATKYADRRDLVEALLDDTEEYTLSEVDQIIKEYMEGGIN